MPNERTRKKPRERYRLRTRLIHGSFATGLWDYDRHVVPPQSSSATCRLSSVQRETRGFVEFESRRAPIYSYDRLDEPSCGRQEENLATAEGREVAVIRHGHGRSQRSTGSPNSHGRPNRGASDFVWLHTQPAEQLAAPPRNPYRLLRLEQAGLTKVATQNCRVVYLETPVNPKMELTDRRAIRQVVNRLNEGRAEAEKIRIVVDNTLPRPASGLCSRASTSLCNALRKTSIRSGLQPGGIRLSLGLEDWHDIVADLEDALEVV